MNTGEMSDAVLPSSVSMAYQRRQRDTGVVGGEAGLPNVAMALTVLLVLLITVFRGGNRALPLLVLEWLALALLLVLAGTGLGCFKGSLGDWGRGPWAAMRLGLAATPAVVALVQLLPWPGVGLISLTPQATIYALLASLPLVAAWCVGLGASLTQVQALCTLWVSVAVAQAGLGLLQLGGSEWLQFGFVTGEKVKGTYASKNTYANLLVMALPLAIAGGLLTLRRRHQRGQKHSHALAPWGWGIAVFVLLAAVLASGSRTGIATGLLIGFLALALLPRDRKLAHGQRSLRLWSAVSGLVLLALALWAGGLSWLDRFDALLLAKDDDVRAVTRHATWQAALAYWPWGSGLGSYRGVFPAWQHPSVGAYTVDPAHSDYLQLLMETGVLGLLALSIAAALIVRRAGQWWRERRTAEQSRQQQSTACMLSLAAGLGAAATALHAWVDYPSHIPANAVMCCFLLGVFLREPDVVNGAPEIPGDYQE